MFKTVAINLSDMESLVCAVIVRRLRDKRWTPEQISQIADKAIDVIRRAVTNDDSLTEVAKDAANMSAGGASDENVQTMVKAAFAIIGVRIADDLHASRNAEWN